MTKTELRRYRRLVGLCAFCGAESVTRFSCQQCAYKRNANRRSLYAVRRISGLCKCGSETFGKRAKCERCIRINSASQSARMPATVRDAFWYSQGGRCACCDSALEDRYAAYADHNHISGAWRGLLCNRCNTTVGYVEYRPWLIDAADAYLDRFSVQL